MTPPLVNFADNLMGGLVTALAFLSVLTVVVFVHEMGHFLVARWCGVKVKAFSIGFGQEIWGFIDKHGNSAGASPGSRSAATSSSWTTRMRPACRRRRPSRA